jgi:two-component system nitrogen regulation response regulator GlnG
VRQLENICHWLTVMAPAQLIEAKDLPPEVMAATAGAEAHAAETAAVTAAAVQPAPLLSPSAERESATATAGAVPEAAAEGLVGASSWESGLEMEAQALLAAGRTDVWDALSRRFESRLILTALANTRGRRIEAAQKLGIGRNTITRKIQELGIE